MLTELGKNIAARRKESGLSQKALAARLFISPQSVSKWEKGDSMPDLVNLCALATLFGVTVDGLLGRAQAEEKTLYLGIDGGGSKTEFILFDAQGGLHGRALLGGSNPNTYGLPATCAILQSGIDRLAAGRRITALFAGIAGCGNEKNRAAVLNFLLKTYPSVRAECRGDIENVLGQLPAGQNCAAAICGTGVVAYAYTDGTLHRAGGWGYLLEGGGSGYDIGRDAMRAALAARESGHMTRLAMAVEKKAGGPIFSQIDRIYKKGIGYIASFAPAVLRAAAEGEREADAILDRHMAHLGALITRLVDRYDCGNTVILAGGLLQKGGLPAEKLRAYLPPSLAPFLPHLPPVYGACVQCCRMAGVAEADLAARFAKQYAALSKER